VLAVLLVALGGALGSVLRYGLTVLGQSWLGVTYPYGTFVANVVGSLLLGLTIELGAGRMVAGVDLRLVLGVGVLGGFTTYSSFNHETLRMLDAQLWARAAGYVGLTVTVCLVAGAIGIWLGRTITGR
jgi:CrcB protein